MTRKKTTKRKTFPKILYVFRDTDGYEDFFIASDNEMRAEHAAPVAIYELKETKTKEIIHNLV